MECINSVKKQKVRKVYKARVGAPFKQEDAQIVGETINNLLQEKGGELIPEDIVREAKKKTNPLHNLFDWDDTSAAEKFRIQQARNITNHIVETIVVDGNPKEIRTIVSVVNKEQERVYVSMEDAIEDVDYKKQLLDQMITTMENLTDLIKLFKKHDYP